MHDLGIRVVSTLLSCGALVFLAFLFYSTLYPRRAQAASPASEPAKSTSYGVLAPVARPLEWMVREVGEHLTRSWGWSIVAVTFLINLVLLPFKLLGARSAQRLKAIQPMIEAINARYKGKSSGVLHTGPEQLRELNELYRAHHVSPMAGSLLALVPFAVLAAFYSVIRGMTELQGAHWLWIADLSHPEQSPIHILPMLMIATQLLVARTTPPLPGADPSARRLATILPLVFGFILYNQPSALVLYWLTSNLLQLAQQHWLARRYPAS